MLYILFRLTFTGKNDEGHSQYTSMYWGSVLGLLRDLSGTNVVSRPDVFIEIHFVNMVVRCNSYPKPPKIVTEGIVINDTIYNDLFS